MTITVELTPEEEMRLQQRAALSGRDLSGYVHELIDRDIRTAPITDVDRALAPFRQQVEASGMTDDQLDAFFEEVREDARQEKQGTLPHRDA